MTNYPVCIVEESFFAVLLRVNPSHLDADPTLTFRGFFVQTRLVADDSNVGGFLHPLAGQEYRLSSCVPSTVSHYMHGLL